MARLTCIVMNAQMPMTITNQKQRRSNMSKQCPYQTGIMCADDLPCRCENYKPIQKEDITCPFCGDTDFDLIGLAIHLRQWCDEYKNTRT